MKRFFNFGRGVKPDYSKAFTLAETLIVIGIIGVVAALTLPNLNHATGDKETVTRLQKLHSALNEANDRAVAIYGPLDEWQNSCSGDVPLSECYFKRITEFMKVSKVCDRTDIEACTTSLDYEEGEGAGSSSAAVLPDGATFLFYDFNNPSCNGESGQYNDICIDYIEVDINGKNKGKNEYGRDQFEFMVSKDTGVVPIFQWDSYEDGVSSCISGKGWSCAFWVLEYGNLDYLKADEEGKCNDSNIVLNGTTNTSCH